jgi:hypothetical protein
MEGNVTGGHWEVRLSVFRLHNQPLGTLASKLSFAVCVPPLFGDLQPATLVQFVELTRILGARHFVFYVAYTT